MQDAQVKAAQKQRGALRGPHHHLQSEAGGVVEEEQGDPLEASDPGPEVLAVAQDHVEPMGVSEAPAVPDLGGLDAVGGHPHAPAARATRWCGRSSRARRCVRWRRRAGSVPGPRYGDRPAFGRGRNRAIPGTGPPAHLCALPASGRPGRPARSPKASGRGCAYSPCGRSLRGRYAAERPPFRSPQGAPVPDARGLRPGRRGCSETVTPGRAVWVVWTGRFPSGHLRLLWEMTI